MASVTHTTPRNRGPSLRDILNLYDCNEGHDWKSRGGCNAGCSKDCACSIPVNECTRCGDCDYGKNDEAIEIRKNCQNAPTHPTSQGLCETTLTERFSFEECVCGTYPDNLGPCRSFVPGANPRRCVYCAHRIGCHTAIRERFETDPGEGWDFALHNF